MTTRDPEGGLMRPNVPTHEERCSDEKSYVPEWFPKFIPPTDKAQDDNPGGVVVASEGFFQKISKNLPFSRQIQALCSDTMQSMIN